MKYPLMILLAALAVSQQSHAAEEIMLEEIGVTATSTPLTERRDAVTQKTVLDRAEIETLGGLTVGEVIRKLPGVDAGMPNADGAPAANARGMSRDSVQFLVDGERPSANARYALTSIGRLPSGELERVEIIRGASAEHGGSAPVTVNLVMRKARPQASSTLKLAAGLRGEGEDAEANGQLTFSQGGGDRGFSWILPVTINHHGMPVEKSVTRQPYAAGVRTAWREERESSPYALDEFILSPRLTWRNDRGGSLSLWPSFYRNQGDKEGRFDRYAYADPAAGTGRTADGNRRESEDSRQTIARLRAEGEIPLAGGKLSGRAAVMDANRHSDTKRRWVDAIGNVTTGDERITRDEVEFSSALRLDRAIGESAFAAGLEQSWHQRDERQSVDGSAREYDGESRQLTLWGQHEWSPFQALVLTGGVRGEHIRQTVDGRTQDSGQIAPSLAIRLELAPDLVLRTSAGGGIKAPKLEELSALTVRTSAQNSPLETDRGGNPALRAERSRNLEVALERHLPGEAGVVGVNAYLRETDDFIERRQLLEGTRWVDRPYNAGTARHWGLELDARLKADSLGIKGGALRGHLTLPHARVDDEPLGRTRDARNLPRYQLTLGYDQALPAWQSSAGFQLIRHGAVRTDIPGELRVEQRPRTLLDLYGVRRLSSSFNLRLEIQNLLRADTRQLADAWSGSDRWHQASADYGQRTLMLSLEGKW